MTERSEVIGWLRHDRVERGADVTGSDCVFCAIVAQRAEASLVAADDDVVAFLDIRPITPGHLLVVPRRHATDLAGLDPDTGAAMWRMAHRLAAALRAAGIRCEGVNLFLADGAAAGQEVFHVHLHVVPRYRGDGFAIRAAFGSPERAELDRLAADIRAAAVSRDPS